ncbi:MAG: flagellar protein FlgN [Candidatus Latescibacterota bacterium]|nr:flagellar protein FlgN [Candidatus Latescibacterota bacterium]
MEREIENQHTPSPELGDLVRVINDEIRVFHELLDTLEQEQKAIVADDLAGIDSAAVAKTEQATRAKVLESERVMLICELSESLEMDAKGADLQKLICAMDGPHSKELTRMREVLLDLNQRIRKTNENNSFLIRQSLRYTERCLDILTGDPGARGLYGKFGHHARRRHGRSILNRTA